MTLTYRNTDLLTDPISRAEDTVLGTYGDVVSVKEKAKSLNKFGKNESVGISFTTIQEFQGSEINETFVWTNLIDSIVSSSASDTGLIISLEGFTIDGSGNLTFVTQDATLNGTTEVTLTTPLARVTRGRVKASGIFNNPQSLPVGTIYVYDNTGGITAGVPNSASQTKMEILAGGPNTEKCSTSISSTDYYFIKSLEAGIGATGGNAARVELKLESRDVANGGLWIPQGREVTLYIDQNGIQVLYEPLIIIPKNHDVRVRARTNSNTASVFAEMRGYLAKVL